MGVGVHVGIDAQRHRRALAPLRRHLFQQRQFRLGFDVETVNAGFQGAFQFITALADPGKHYFAGIAARRQHPFQLADRDDVETRSQPRQHVQHRQIAVGLDRVADQMRVIAEGAVEGAPVPLDGGAGVDVAGGADRRRDVGDRHVLGEQPAVAIFKMIHGSGLRGRGLLG